MATTINLRDMDPKIAQRARIQAAMQGITLKQFAEKALDKVCRECEEAEVIRKLEGKKS